MQWLIREKLEAYVVAVRRAIEFEETSVVTKINNPDKFDNKHPIHEATMLQNLYLPELSDPHTLFTSNISNFMLFINEGSQTLRASEGDTLVAQEFADQLIVKLEELHNAERKIKLSAFDLAKKINQVSPVLEI